ncbi:MAG: tRNA lysidine(34) synthetase TilS [Burkholderiales bacterium]|jgi:tRNA(Ile)-lysidine synthase|nr:tRNA lysidine(34) synthetase TilS [Burkholderiales bacterium]
MANSGKSRSSDVVAAVRGAVAPRVAPGTRLVVGLSGGVDSVALLDILARLAPDLRFDLAAVHVHHGISPNADAWAAYCGRLAERVGVPLAIERVDIAPFRRLGLEGAARAARYEAFAAQLADFVVLAHHADDQAETLLVQLARGTGLAGLAGMPVAARAAPGAPAVLRPLLDVARADIEAYARERHLEWVDDESNADPARPRSFIRHRVMPALRELRPGVASALSRSAALVAEAAVLVEELARIDEASALADGRLAVAGLARLSEPRARNLLRHHLAARGVPVPDSRALGEMLRQLLTARADGRVEFRIGEWRLRRYRGALWVDRNGSGSPAALDMPWSGEPVLRLPALSGTLRFGACTGDGLAAGNLRDGVRVRTRRGGERIRLREQGPRRALKDLFQESGVPPWQRGRLPLVFCGNELAWVPGIGPAWEFRARPGEAGLRPVWEPA